MVNFKGPWVSAPDSKKRFKEQTEVTVNGIRYKIKVVDDYELHWFRNITVGAFKTEVHESKGEINPSKSDTKPLGNDTNSSKSDAQPLQSETNPSKCETNPSKSETKPSKGDSKPLESEPNPSKSETQPLKSEPNILKRKTSNTTPSDIESSKPGKSPKTAHESSEESPGNMPLVNCENVSAEDDESESAGEEDDQFETTEEDDDESYSAEEDTDHVNDDFDYDSDESEEDAHAVGYVIARLMRRGLIANTFWEDMEEPSQDTSALGFDIFDRYGGLRSEFITGKKKGSGIWGKELGTGNMLQVETVSVNEEFRKRGIATELLSQLLQKAQSLDPHFSFAFAWPTILNSRLSKDLSKEQYKEQYARGEDMAIGLFRKAGYRRIGSSNWFALAVDPSHASRSLDPNQDFDSPAGYSPSALEKFEDSLELKRTQLGHGMMTVVRSDEFRGFTDTDVQELLRLRGSAAQPMSAEYLRAKFGCTCKECLGGYISRSMQHTLFHQAEMMYDMLEDLGMTLRECNVDIDDEDDLSFLLPDLHFIPPTLRSFMKSNKSVAEGYRTMFAHVATCLKKKSLPTIRNLFAIAMDASEWPPNSKNYLQKTNPEEAIGAVLRGLFAWGKSQDRNAGDDMFMEDFEIEGLDMTNHPMSEEFKELQREKELAESKECRNDSEFDFVLGMLLQT